MKGSDSSDIKYNNRPQSLNGFEEMVEFLPAANSKKVEKMSLKKKLLIAGLVVGAFLLSLTAGLLIWHFAYRNTPVQKIYTGSLRVTNYPFIDAYENPSSPEFADLSAKVIETLQKTYQTNRALGPHFVQSNVTAFSEGSVISYYWTEFSVPKYLEAKLDAAMSDLKVQTVTLRQRTALSVDSLVAYPVDPLLARNFRDNKCIFFLHSSPGSVTKFSSPGFPNSPYPPNSRCQWALRADAGHMVVLHFKTFRMESCKPPKGDYVHIYDSLTAMEPRLMKDLCGSYPPSYNLTFISSQNVMLVTLGSDDKEKHPGFMAEFFQIPKTTLCGGTIRNAGEGVISSPFYPAHYPPNRDCVWEIEVPADKFVKVRFQMFYLYEPGVSVNSCPKDYVEIDNKRYCGERSPFVVSNNSSKITVKFHSDQSYSDTGFTAQYIPYEPQNPCPDQFTCKSGRCIDKSRNCDGWNDCGDSSDEQMCVCTAQQFRCKTSQYCKPRFFLCDGVNDCGDGSDEQDCKCPDNFLKCRNGKCIPVAQKCDNTDNCGDGTDESDCGSAQDTTCTDYTYKCDDGKCINKLNPDCDGVKDCADGSDEAFCNCGKRPYSRKTRIVGGVNADIGEWPWQVSLQTKKDGHTCGASLVSPTILLSAAHCFQDTSGLRYSDPSVWTAYLGLHDQGTKTTSKDVVVRKIKRVVTNRGFNDYTYDNDIAMLELESPVTYTDFIQPICIPETTHVFPVGKQIWVTGWGAVTEGGIGASILQKAEIRVINQTECNKLLEDQLTARMICAGYVSGGIDACQGDSGGPLSSVEVNGKVYLAGIVSWGEGCARRNKPGVYTKVTAMRDWIKQNTGL